jgi:hypothetical protein
LARSRKRCVFRRALEVARDSEGARGLRRIASVNAAMETTRRQVTGQENRQPLRRDIPHR